jgi:hypothetical protein
MFPEAYIIFPLPRKTVKYFIAEKPWLRCYFFALKYFTVFPGKKDIIYVSKSINITPVSRLYYKKQ